MTRPIDSKTFRYSCENGVAAITLNRPERLNSLTFEVYRELGQLFAELNDHDEVRSVLLTGEGRAFCSGLDLSAPPELPSSTRAERLDPYAWVGTWVRSVLACEKPVIAAINGPAAGAGLGLALACDIRIVAESAKLTAGYVRRGLVPRRVDQRVRPVEDDQHVRPGYILLTAKVLPLRVGPREMGAQEHAAVCVLLDQNRQVRGAGHTVRRGHERRCLRVARLGGGHVPLLRHQREDRVAALDVARRVADGIVARGAFRQRRE